MNQNELPRHNASASKTDLLLVCPWWAAPGVKLPPDPDDPENTRNPKLLADAPRFGVAFHLVMEKHLQKIKFSIKQIAESHNVDDRRLQDYYERATSFLKEYFKSKGWTKINLFVEQKLAYNPFNDSARFLQSSGTRDYSKRKAHELPGTLDIAAKLSSKEFFTADWKTGVSVYDADDNKQLDTLSLGLSRVWNMQKATSHNAIFRIDDEFIEPTEAQVGPARWDKHRKKLKLALTRAYAKVPFMRPGIHCTYCPANEICPAVVGPSVLADMASEAIDSEGVRKVYEMAHPLDKALEKIRKRVTNWVRDNGPIELSNGKELRIVEFRKDNLSKSSIERALGRAAAHDVLADLRSKKCIETEEVKQLREVIVR